MTAHFRVLTGPPQCGKTSLLLEEYRLRLKTAEPGACLWIAPTGRAAASVRDMLLNADLPCCFAPGIMTFKKFAQTVLEASHKPILPLKQAMKRRLVRQILDDLLSQNRIAHFKAIAQTAGLVDLIIDFIGEMKRLEVWPQDFLNACRSRGAAAKDDELFEIYEAYQDSLLRHNLYDEEGRFWQARDRLQQGQRRPYDALRWVVLDGFADFTKTQHEILQILASFADEIVVSLPLEDEPRRDDLFSKPLKTLDELRERHKNDFSHRVLPRPATSAWPALRHIERRLFTNPRTPEDAPTTEGVEIIAAAKPSGELRQIASIIKRILVKKLANPADIVVVFRSEQEPGGVVEEAFYQHGIPVAWERGRPLIREPVLKALCSFLDLHLNDWPFRELLAVVGSNYFRPEWTSWENGARLAEIERTIRDVRLSVGRDLLFSELRDASEFETAAKRSDTDDETLALRIKARSRTLETLQKLADAFDALPKKASLGGWASAWRAFALDVGLLPQTPSELGNGQNASDDAADFIAWRQMSEALESADELAKWMGSTPIEYDLAEAHRILVDLLKSERMPIVDDGAGQVRILSALSARSLQIPYLFLANLTEKSFPRSDREDQFYGEAERIRLIKHGLPLAARHDRYREEMLLFYETLLRATKRIVLSYPALDDAARPLSPSSYLTEVESACGKTRVPKIESVDFRPIPLDEEPLSAASFRAKAMADAVASDSKSRGVELLAGLFQFADDSSSNDVSRRTLADAAKNVISGLDLGAGRENRTEFGVGEGMLTTASVAHDLKRLFPADRTFVATELESYAACPYRFLMSHVLKIEPLKEVELEADLMQRGFLLHEILSNVHRAVNERLGRPASPCELDRVEFNRLMEHTIADQFFRKSANPVRDAWREIDRRVIFRWLADYYERHAAYDEIWRSLEKPLVPTYFEASFGKMRRSHAETEKFVDQPLELDAGEETLYFSGRIDRIDVGVCDGEPVFGVIDYKTGGGSKFDARKALRGLSLQLPLYALAVADLFLFDQDAIPWHFGYWNVAKGGFPKKPFLLYHPAQGGAEPEPEWEDLRLRLSEILLALVHGIRRGRFPVYNSDKRCTGYCEFAKICRINPIRSLDKIWSVERP